MHSKKLLGFFLFCFLYPLGTFAAITWSETQPAGNLNKNWETAASSDDGQVLLAGVYGGRLYRSTDGGDSWGEVQPAGDVNKNWFRVSMSDDGEVMLAGVYNGRLYISTDGGDTWGETQPSGNSDRRKTGVLVGMKRSRQVR